ncbi:MAG: ABC transporter permease [Bacteroidia bacterium]|nr:ABC transporter permease [Bacteroidia bacterium]
MTERRGFGKLLHILGQHVPGITQIRRGRRLTGWLLLSYLALFPVIIIGRFGYFIDSLISLALTAFLLVFDSIDSSLLLREDTIEHWIAAVFLLVMPVLLWYLHRRYLRRSETTDSDTEVSQWTIARREFAKNRLAIAALLLVGMMYTVAFLCPFIAPFDPNVFQDGVVTQFRPPFSVVPVLYLAEDRDPEPHWTMAGIQTNYPEITSTVLSINRELEDHGLKRERAVEAFRVEESNVMATEGDDLLVIPIASLISPHESEFAGTRTYVLGTDSYGRDLLSRIIYGSRISLSLGFLAVLISVTFGTLIGLLAGYFGRWTETVLMRTVDILLAFPTLFLILMIIAAFESVAVPRSLLIVVILGLTSWMGIARLVRGEVLSLKEREFVLAGKALGLGHVRIMIRHILPNTLSPIIVNATLRIGGIILVEAALSYLNVGVQPPTASWGNIIFEGKDFMSHSWWISTIPGFAIVIVVVCFNLIGDGLRDAFDPMLANERQG